MFTSYFRITTLCLSLLSKSLIAQTTYFVSETGNDEYNGLTSSTAFATFQHAADIVSAGDSVLVLSGNYSGFDLRENGTQNSPIVFSF